MFRLGKVRNLNGFYDIRHLTALFASHNLVHSISPRIAQLTSLTLLDLSYNQITLIPTEIGDMGSLTHLNISNNQLKTLPAEMGKLFRLKALSKYFFILIWVYSPPDISNNPLPNDLLAKSHGVSGTSNVLQHLLDKLASKKVSVISFVTLLHFSQHSSTASEKMVQSKPFFAREQTSW